MPPAYCLTFVNLSLSIFDFPVSFLRLSDVRKSGGCESVHPFEFNVDAVDCVDSEHVETSRVSPAFPGVRGRARWLKRMGIATSFTELVPLVGGASEGVGCIDHRTRYVDGEVDADVLVD